LEAGFPVEAPEAERRKHDACPLRGKICLVLFRVSRAAEKQMPNISRLMLFAIGNRELAVFRRASRPGPFLNSRGRNIFMQWSMSIHSAVPRLFVLIGLFACLGCGGNEGIPVRGEVTYGGRPVDSGGITFQFADGSGPSTGGAITDGHYKSIEDAAPLPGKKTVRIRSL
jgi:hypothetical protein